MRWIKFLFSFDGRVSRKAFWLFLLALLVISVLNAVLDLLLRPMPRSLGPTTDPSAAFIAALGATPWWHWALTVLVLVSSLAVYAKRWHDQDRSGWWALIILVPVIGPLITLVMCGFIAGTPGPNRYGDRPMV